jgi:hypothetical protein
MKKQTTKTTLLSLLALTLAAVPDARAISNSFANATVIPGSNQNAGSVSILNFDTEAGEPGHLPNSAVGAQKSAWWKWTATSNGFCTVDTQLDDDDQFVRNTVVAVYTGSAVNGLTPVARNNNHALSPNYAAAYAASATFYASQGTTYYIAVDGYNTAAVNANNHKVRLRLRFMTSAAETRLGNITNPYEPGVHGILQLNKTSSHAFSAKLTLAGKAYPFKGVFSLDGYFVTSFERKVAKGATPLPPLTLMLDGTENGSFDLVSSISGNTGYGLTTVQRFTKAQPTSFMGSYTAAIHNSGSMSFKIAPTGTITGASVLPDGTKATFGSFVSTFRPDYVVIPFYTSLHSNVGFYGGFLKLTEMGAVDKVEDEIADYYRPAKAGAVFYPQGINLSAIVVGSTYTPPTTGARALGFLDASMGVGKLSIAEQGGEITPAMMENLTLSTANVIKFNTPQLRKPVLTLNKTTGLVTGSILDQAGKKRSLSGVLFRDGMTVKLKGHLTGTTYNPLFEVVP